MAHPRPDHHFEFYKKEAQSQGLTLFAMVDVEMLGFESPVKDYPPVPDNLAVICYTSGTTDQPKGVMLTHENIVANFSAILHHLSSKSHDSHIL